MEENNIQLVELLRELTQIQAQLTAIISTKFERQTMDMLQSRVSQRQNNVLIEAKRYGQDSMQTVALISDYSNALEDVRQEYSTEKNLWLAQAEEFQNNEVRTTLQIAKLQQDREKGKEQNLTRTTTQQPSKNNESKEAVHPVLKFNEVLQNVKNASLEDVSAQLDYYNGKPVMIDGISHHPFNEPLAAAKLNARYFELTGKNHPVFLEEAPKVIDHLIKDEKILLQSGAYKPSYFAEITKLKNTLDRINEKEEPTDHETKISEKKKKLKAVREASKEAKDNIRDCQKRCYDKIDDISEDKALVQTDNKQNIFKKLFSKIKDRIGGKEKFNRNVIEPLKNKISNIKEVVLPNVKNEIEQNVIPKHKSLLEKGMEKISELNLKEKTDKLMDIARSGAKTIVEKGNMLKNAAISTFSKGISLAVEGVSKVAEHVISER